MKKIISLLLALFALITGFAFSTTAFSADDGDVLYQDDCLVKVEPSFKGELIIKDGTVKIEEQAFKGCKEITKIHIPASLTEIYTQEYDYCESLKEISADKDNSAYLSIDGVLYSKDGETVIKYPRAKKSDVYTVSSAVKAIGDGAFSFSSIKKVIIPANVKTIGVHAFSYSNVASVKLKSGINAVEQLAFVNCKNLRSVKVPKSVKTIGYGAFGCYECSRYKDDSDPVLYKRHLEGAWFDDDFKVCNYAHNKFTLYGYRKSAAERYSYGGFDENDEDGEYSYLVNFTPLDFAKPNVKITGKKGKIKIRYQKVKGADGFQVAYKKKGAKAWKNKTFKSKRKVTKTLRKLKKGKYSVKARAYYYVSNRHIIYGKWTKLKTVKVK